ncbi:hypothetical protein QUF58_08755 [Anaerolineales bacterium HSG24]|nr:hypothetical protein [Anaerolineales bacterium HSG24]
MKTYLQEKIGNPDLFTGRKQELTDLLHWLNRIPVGLSKSRAILSRRKTGKSALMQRFYNLIFHANGPVIPFYFEIKEADQWLGHFAERFFKTFIFQYLAFKTRNMAHIDEAEWGSLDYALEIATEAELVIAQNYIKRAQTLIQAEEADPLWDLVRDAPRIMARYDDDYIVQMIDEFQYINRFIFRDESCTHCIDTLAGSYLHTAEYKNAPLLVSGSWVGWLMDDLIKMLPGRFKYRYMADLSLDECIEMIYRYALIEEVPISEDTAYLMARLTEGSPFYISSVFRSTYPHKDLTTEQGLLETLEFEILDKEGEIRGTWLEYIDSAFPRINERYAKDIVLYLSKHRDRLTSRQTLKRELNLDMSDDDLRTKLKALLRSDIIEENYFKYQGVQDNIFDKVFRSEYGHDIENFSPQGLRDEYKVLFEGLLKKYNSLSGHYNRYKGAFAEFMIIQHLQDKVGQNRALYQTMFHNLPPDFEFVTYKAVWPYHSLPLHEPEFQIDVFAKTTTDHYSLIGEVKHRQRKFSLTEAEEFVEKAQSLLLLEPVKPYLLFVFSSAGFQPTALDYFRANGLAWSDEARLITRP